MREYRCEHRRYERHRRIQQWRQRNTSNFNRAALVVAATGYLAVVASLIVIRIRN